MGHHPSRTSRFTGPSAPSPACGPKLTRVDRRERSSASVACGAARASTSNVARWMSTSVEASRRPAGDCQHPRTGRRHCRVVALARLRDLVRRRPRSLCAARASGRYLRLAEGRCVQRPISRRCLCQRTDSDDLDWNDRTSGLVHLTMPTTGETVRKGRKRGSLEQARGSR